jgi:hypothetical protein
MTVNISVLPQAGVRTVVLAGAGHQSKPIAMPTRLSLLLAGPEAQISRRSCPKSSRLSTGGSRGVGEWPAWRSFDAPGTVADAVGRFLAEWAS